LHARDDDFAATRYFVETHEITRPKKCVRIIMPPPPDHISETVSVQDNSSYFQTLLKGFKDVLQECLPPASVKTVNREPSPIPASQSTRDGNNRRDSQPNN